MFDANLALFVPFWPEEVGNPEGGFLLCSQNGVRDLDKNNTRGPGYNFYVARGWESKSVEEQQAEAATTASPAKPQLTPGQIASQRKRHGLMLSRQHVLQQLEAVQNPRHREILQKSLADLDAQLARLV